MPTSKIYSFDQLPVALSVTQVSEVLGISKTNAYTLFRREDFPTIRIGRRYLVARDHFISWFSKQSDTNY